MKTTLPLLLILGGMMLAHDSSQAAPPNDNFADRISLAGASVATTGHNTDATAESGEPDPASYSAHKSVWWTWTAPASGNITLTTTGSDFDTILTVFTGNDLANLTWVAFNDYDLLLETNTSRITMNVIAGTTYQIAVDATFWGTASGNISLQLDLGPTVPSPANDNFANRITLTGTRINTSSSNLGATRESAEALHDQIIGGKSVWWSWTAPSSGAVTLATAGSRFDTVLAVYRGSSLSDLTLAGANDDDPKGMGVDSKLTFNARSGTAYQIVVDGYEAEAGDVTLRLTLDNPLPVPPNDDFANRTILSGTNIAAQGSNEGATFEVGEPLHDQLIGGKSVWWTWTAPRSGIATLDTFGSDFDTMLAIYAGSSVSNLAWVASNDQWSNDTSLVSLTTTAGTTYQIAVDGWETSAGNVALHLALIVPSYSLAVNITPPSQGSVSASPLPGPDGKYLFGTEVTLTAMPGQDYSFIGWTAPSFYNFINPLRLTLGTDLTLTANFALVPPPRLFAIRQTAADIQAQGYRYYLSGAIHYAYVSQYSTDLYHWTSFQTNQLTTNQLILIHDAGAASEPHRYYRAVRLP